MGGEMMENILTLLYRDEYTMMQTKYEKTAAYTLALEKADTLEEEFRGKLPKELLPLFDQLKAAAMNVLDACGLHDFKAGYQLGVRLMIAAFPDDGRNEHDEN